MKLSKDAILLIVMFLALVIGGVFIASPPNPPEVKQSTTYNADPMGVKAFYTLLNRLGYRSERLREPYTDMPKDARVLIVVQPNVTDEDNSFSALSGGDGISEDESDALHRWVSNGGTVLFFADRMRGVPDDFTYSRRLMDGYVYAYDSRKKITNKSMRNPRNAVELLSIIDKHAGKQGLILFDEYHHGVRESKPFLSYVSKQAWIAIGITLFALILLCYSRGRRFGAVRNLPKSETVRPGYEYVESVARLYQRAHASDLAAGILCDSFRQQISRKWNVESGKSARIDIREIKQTISDEFNPELAARVVKVLKHCDQYDSQLSTLNSQPSTPQKGDKLTESELLDIAREIQQLEKELGIGS